MTQKRRAAPRVLLRDRKKDTPMNKKTKAIINDPPINEKENKENIKTESNHDEEEDKLMDMNDNISGLFEDEEINNEPIPAVVNSNTAVSLETIPKIANNSVVQTKNDYAAFLNYNNPTFNNNVYQENKYSNNDFSNSSFGMSYPREVLEKNYIAENNDTPKKYPSLTGAEHTSIKRHARKEIFHRVKFVTTEMFDYLLPKCYDTLKITDEVEKALKKNSIIRLVKDTLNSRRGYASQLVSEKLRNKMIEDDMFDLDFLDKFREHDINGSENVISDDIKKAWFSFLYDFCTCVSYEWSNYINSLTKYHQVPFHGYLSTSDEAFTIWLIKCKYNSVKEDVRLIKEMGQAEWKEKRKKKKSGAHHSREKLDDYINIYNDIRLKTENQHSVQNWEQVFVTEFFNEVTDIKEQDDKTHSYTLKKLLPIDCF